MQNPEEDTPLRVDKGGDGGENVGDGKPVNLSNTS